LHKNEKVLRGRKNITEQKKNEIKRIRKWDTKCCMADYACVCVCCQIFGNMLLSMEV